jgi:hypothetical protein
MTEMAQVARIEADKARNAKDAGDKAAELGKQATEKVAESTRDAVAQAEAVADHGYRSVRQAADAVAEAGQDTLRLGEKGLAEVNHSLLDLLNQQTRHNVQVAQTLAQPANWSRAIEVQNEFLRASLERATQFGQRYVAASQAFLTGQLQTTRRDAKKA